MVYFLISAGSFAVIMVGMAAFWYTEYRDRIEAEQWASQLWDENSSLRHEKVESDRKIAHLREQVLHGLFKEGDE